MPKTERTPDFKTFLCVLGGFVALVWAITFIDTALFHHRLANGLGVLPRRLLGLRGIVFMPFLHGNFSHVASNTVPFLILGGLVLCRGVKEFAIVSLCIMLVCGLGTWLAAPSGTVHVGASGLIFGYFGYLIMRAWYDGRFVSGLIAILVVVLYGGMIFGIRPFQQGISWQGHLFGLCGGIAAASRWGSGK
ncbi:TPA: rhomboid family intramembrane serine protease [Candidatus Sumerlaeota bacterium]|jgi:membrane associated rhomboid family serine protease|nr:rhomboid family intramembrane serine protease [Candidatus Sumerlaeota bacterium]